VVCLHHRPAAGVADAGASWWTQCGRGLVRHVDFVAATFRDLVGGWQPVNGRTIRARPTAARLAAGHNDRDECARASGAIHLAAEAVPYGNR
jgi:beta-glucosidase